MRPGIGSAIFSPRLGSPNDEPPGNSGVKEKCAQHDTKTDVVIPVVRIVPVARGTTDVPVIIVERPAAKNTVARTYPALPMAKGKWPGHSFRLPFAFCHGQKI